MNINYYNLEQKADKLIKEYNMIENGDNILVAFSGGSDSSALLFYLIERFGKEKVCAAHMNHMIRGEEAYRDEEFAVEICGKYGVKVFTERQNVPDIAKKSKKSLEEAARDVRYDFLRRIAAELGENTKIATAHTASDNAETVIFNMARGCGINGLCGISPVNITANGCIIRPFLSCDKRDILKYCEETNISYVEDNTNRDDNYTRNFIRHNISAKLREKFANADENIFKMTNIVRDVEDLINFEVESIMANHTGGMPVSGFIRRHKAIRCAVIMQMYENVCAKKLEYRHVEYLDKLLQENKLVKIDLPEFVKAQVINNKFSFCKKNDSIKKENNNNVSYEKNIVSGVNIVYGEDGSHIMEIIVSSESAENIKIEKINLQSSENIYNLFNYAVIDFDKIKRLMFARNRKTGDEYVFFGQTKNVKKNYINYKVPADLRGILPVLCDGDGIFWACGLHIADRVRVTEDTKNAISIRVNLVN
ncbi:MAG: tRNA lysidine(34) synthetase TilS [Oscillospiraceae bacterium]|nr:tRNA lysidine(34) synthetase TilS [Oscillospiraceae bacterium]